MRASICSVTSESIDSPAGNETFGATASATHVPDLTGNRDGSQYDREQVSVDDDEAVSPIVRLQTREGWLLSCPTLRSVYNWRRHQARTQE